MKLTKKSISIALGTMFSLTLVLYAVSLFPSELEAKALEILDNKQTWQELQTQAVYLETQLQEIRTQQSELHEINVQLEAEIDGEIGFIQEKR